MLLSMGGNAPIEGLKTDLVIHFPQGASCDATALIIYPGGKVRGDADMCFFNQTSIGGGSVSLVPSGGSATFKLDLSKAPSDAEKIVFTLTTEGLKTFGDLQGVLRASVGSTEISFPCAGRSERAIILTEIYKRNGAWKIRNVSQGFDGGLDALATHFGVDVAAPETPKKVETPKPSAPKINLSKVSLTKTESRISLTKSDGKFGKIVVNLNWNQKKSGGLFGMGKRGIDLDVGAFVESKDGLITAVQALGNSFGYYQEFPYVQLLADDRTGASTAGEFLEINGNEWSKIKRILVYAFIYEGAPNWQETDGVIKITIPNQPEVEVRMNEFGSRDPMCAVALLENDGGDVKVSREMTFHKGHRPMDQRYSWGLRWTAGRK